MTKTLLNGCIGFAVGLFLMIVGVLACETGRNGTTFFFLVYTAPCGLLPKGLLVLTAALAVCTLFGALSANAESRVSRLALVILLVMHYLSIPVLLLTSGDIGGVAEFKTSWQVAGPLLVLSAPIYLLCHFYLCRRAFGLTRERTEANIRVDHIPRS